MIRDADKKTQTDTHAPVRHCTYRKRLTHCHCFQQPFTHDFTVNGRGQLGFDWNIKTKHDHFMRIFMCFKHQHEYKCSHTHTHTLSPSLFSLTLSHCLSLLSRMMTSLGCIWYPSSLNDRLRPSNVTFIRYL